jgi:hypothetical protein
MTNSVERLARHAGTDRTENSEEEVERADQVAPEEAVPDILAADPRFQPLFRSEAYRLTNQRSRVTTREVARLTRRANEVRPRIITLFAGSTVLEVTPFLLRLRKVADEAGISEGMVLRLLPDLMVEPALTSFRTSQPKSFPSAIRWLLLTYACSKVNPRA